MAALKGSMGGVTLERSKLDRRQKVQTQEPKLSNDGGGGGIGNKIFNGGGGDGDDGDDDDYFNFDGGDGDGDESFWRTAVRHFPPFSPLYKENVSAPMLVQLAQEYTWGLGARHTAAFAHTKFVLLSEMCHAHLRDWPCRLESYMMKPA